MQRITIIGNVGQDAAIKQSNGNEFITFSVAVNDKFKNRDGVEVEKTKWYNCLYQPKSMAVATYLKKGTRVFVEGKPNIRTYKNKNDETEIDFGVQVRGIELLSAATHDAPKPDPVYVAPEPAGKAEKPKAKVPAETEPDDLPF